MLYRPVDGAVDPGSWRGSAQKFAEYPDASVMSFYHLVAVLEPLELHEYVVAA
jgi:hypothetical protein